MNEMITPQLIETTYMFCYNRLYNKQDAEDLAQEILCEALTAIRTGKNISHFYPWYWKMAHNRYATFLSLRTYEAVPLESYEGVVANSLALEEELISQEDYAELNYAISRLGSIHREILILFYLKEYSISAIAEKLSIPIGTVKGRLFDARKNLKERLETMNNTGTFAYAPSTLSWFGGYNACKHDDYMNNLITQQILILCRTEPKSMTQVGDEMGVAPVYLEHFFHELLDRRLLKEAIRGKYLSDICVFPQQPYTYADINGNNISLLLQLAQNPTLELSPHAEEMVANFIQQGLVAKVNGALQVQIPIMDSKTSKELYKLIHPALAPIAIKYEKEISKSVEDILLPYVRKDLLEEFVHWNMGIFLQPTGLAFHYAMWETDILPKPQDFHSSAAGLWIRLHS